MSDEAAHPGQRRLLQQPVLSPMHALWQQQEGELHSTPRQTQGSVLQSPSACAKAWAVIVPSHAQCADAGEFRHNFAHARSKSGILSAPNPARRSAPWAHASVGHGAELALCSSLALLSRPHYVALACVVARKRIPCLLPGEPGHPVRSTCTGVLLVESPAELTVSRGSFEPTLAAASKERSTCS